VRFRPRAVSRRPPIYRQKAQQETTDRTDDATDRTDSNAPVLSFIRAIRVISAIRGYLVSFFCGRRVARK
jgi:hypothetical protein